MTAAELAAALLAYGESCPVTARASPFLPRGEARLSASSPTGEDADVEVELLVGAEPWELDDSIPF